MKLLTVNRTGDDRYEEFWVLTMQSIACSSNWLAVTLSSEALITSLSPNAEQFTGCSAQELVGRPITDILADRTAFEVPRILDTAKEWGYWQGEVIHRSNGGRHFDARSTMSLLAGNRNLSAGYLLISNLNQSLALDESERSAVAEVSTTLRKFAHDLNNPLAVMMGFAQLLILNQNCQGNVRKDMEKLYSELKRVIQAVEGLHEYAISLNGKPQEKSNVAV
jgi:PAS domain S-box-containing protein